MSGIEENEKAILRGELYDPIGYDWMFKILRGLYREPDGPPIVRIMKQLGEIGGVITRELEVWVRNPGGVWDWIVKKRRDHKSTGRLLTSRDMYIYFKDCIVAKSRKLSGVIGRHFASLEFSADLEESDGGKFQGKLGN